MARSDLSKNITIDGEYIVQLLAVMKEQTLLCNEILNVTAVVKFNYVRY